jgi:hypothetical protein
MIVPALIRFLEHELSELLLSPQSKTISSYPLSNATLLLLIEIGLITSLRVSIFNYIVLVKVHSKVSYFCFRLSIIARNIKETIAFSYRTRSLYTVYNRVEALKL